MKYTRQQIFDKVAQIMHQLFEIPLDTIKMESRLYEDLGLDSIDAIDLITQLQSFVGQRIRPEDFKMVRTVEDIINTSEKIFDNIE